ncbi:MAG TPA: hypothetical protein VK446_16005 [Methylocystis sp.]|nr:hypothetical protein [Methylocystis sp.]
MTAFITEFVNASRNPIVIADDAMQESFSIPAGGDGNPCWEICGARARHAIRGLNEDRADWIWDDGARNIMILRAGVQTPEVLARLNGHGVAGLALTYDEAGRIHAAQSRSAQARAAELAF